MACRREGGRAACGVNGGSQTTLPHGGRRSCARGAHWACLHVGAMQARASPPALHPPPHEVVHGLQRQLVQEMHALPGLWRGAEEQEGQEEGPGAGGAAPQSPRPLLASRRPPCIAGVGAGHVGCCVLAGAPLPAPTGLLLVLAARAPRPRARPLTTGLALPQHARLPSRRIFMSCVLADSAPPLPRILLGWTARPHHWLVEHGRGCVGCVLALASASWREGGGAIVAVVVAATRIFPRAARW